MYLPELRISTQNQKATKLLLFLNKIDEIKNLAQNLDSVKVYAEPCQTSKMKLFAIIVRSRQLSSQRDVGWFLDLSLERQFVFEC